MIPKPQTMTTLMREWNYRGEQILSANDVLTLPADHFPYVVFSANLFKDLGRRIRRQRRWWANHAMVMTRPGFVETQGVMFRRVPVRSYFGSSLMKFVHPEGWTDEQRQAFTDRVEADLALPWWRRLYDFPAIIGQLTNFQSIQIPGLEICSSRVGLAIAAADPSFYLRQASPDQINSWMKDSGNWNVDGYYIPLD